MTTTHTTHQLETFPAELRSRRQWVLWAVEERDGKPTKVPRRVDAPAMRASSTDPASWSSFDDAVAALAATTQDEISGVGFVFTRDDPFAGVDLDKCMSPDGKLVPEAQRIVDHLSSYTERSPSGMGVHIIVRSHMDAGRKAMQEWGGHLEMYPDGRYFTVTGEHIEGTPATVEERQLQLEELLPAKAKAPAAARMPAGGFDGDDLELLELARNARNGDRFSRLYDAGDTSSHGDDASAADLALCNLLAFWTGRDAARMDRLFRGSGLMREKWDDPARAGETYGEGTIREAIEGCTETYTPPRVANEQEGPEQTRDVVHGPAEGTACLELEEVLKTYRKWLLLPDDPASVLIPLAVAQANRMAGDPVWLLDVRPPGWGKTEGLGPIAGALREAHMVSTLTEAALLSGTSRREKAKDSTGGLLRTVGEFGIIVLKDFTSILSMHREQRASTIAALREIYDGSWVRNVGTDGGRTLEWHGKVGLIAGCTEVYDRAHGVIGAMGDRFLVHRPPTPLAREVAERSLEVAGHEAEMRHELTEAVAGLFVGLPFAEQPELLAAGSKEREQLVDVALIAVQARSTVERDDYSREIENTHGAEAPTRVVKALMQIRSALITIGVEPDEAHRLTTCVALDSIPQHRRRLLRDLVVLGPERRVTTKDASGDLGLPVRTTERVLEDLAAQGMVLCEAGSKGPGNATQWRIAPSWYAQWQRSVPAGL
jgi:primase-polymerase (primpol)-like protein